MTALIDKAHAIKKSCVTRSHYQTCLNWLGLASQQKITDAERASLTGIWLATVWDMPRIREMM